MRLSLDELPDTLSSVFESYSIRVLHRGALVELLATSAGASIWRRALEPFLSWRGNGCAVGLWAGARRSTRATWG